jgi:hypothetical protein
MSAGGQTPRQRSVCRARNVRIVLTVVAPQLVFGDVSRRAFGRDNPAGDYDAIELDLKPPRDSFEAEAPKYPKGEDERY